MIDDRSLTLTKHFHVANSFELWNAPSVYFGAHLMFRSFLVAAFCCAITAGCATMPTEQADGVSLAAVEERVKCEIGRAYLNLKQQHSMLDLDRWAAGLTLTLAVDSTGGVAPSTSLVGPYGSVSPLELNVGASLNAKRTALLNIFVAFVEAARHKCDDNRFQPIEGHLGLAEWIERVFQAQFEVERRAVQLGHGYRGARFDADKSLGYTLEFLVTLNAGATPNFIITGAPTKSAFSIETKSTHSVDIAMLEISPEDFKKRFEMVTVPATTKQVKSESFDPTSQKTITTFRTEAVPAHRERRLVGVEATLGPYTKDRLFGVLQQLNNKVLIQSLRR